jgi:CyaY protein
MTEFYSTMNADSMITPSERHRVPRQGRCVLSHIEVTFDRWLQEDVVDIDASRTGGLLELSFPNGSKIVINTQPPLHELWLAARSGGYPLQAMRCRWRDTRDGREFFGAVGLRERAGGVGLSFEAPEPVVR